MARRFVTGAIKEIEALNLGLGISYEPRNEIGYEDVVCTSWNVCPTRSGASLVPAEVIDTE